ncbi:hypothetical protein [Kribbella solani]|uniref:HAD family phosphatase n=1 Tax=Kribbella solani TaxID=236067 RepID=A0A841DN53_9ACTN|nr:hypothetical protein [Kribbella solani]MBB5976898.1 hypothetical protein [Kribbella solani]
MAGSYRGLILDFGGVLTTRMRLNGEAFERAANLVPAEVLGIRTVHHTTDPTATANLLDSLLLIHQAGPTGADRD